ncbi:MAG: magnesium/cobalt transporter CorA [Pirellulales bacterium]|nr:magnesium/cobalt transporter CorA [Pirellulales bacterium]
MNEKLRKMFRLNVRMRRRTPPGHAPGSVVVDPTALAPEIRVIRYGPDGIEEKTLPDVEAVPGLLSDDAVLWIDLVGLGDAGVIHRLGEIFGLHPLALEDVVNTHQRSKVEDFGNHLYIVARMFASATHLDSEQLSIFLGKNFVLTLQERPGDCLEPVRQRIRKGNSLLRARGSDYLVYALLDAVVDSYFPILESYGERLDRVDEDVSLNPKRETMEEIHTLRGELLLLRRAVWPLRDALGQLLRDSHPLICDDTRLFLRDGYDHTIQIIDLIETSREMCSDLRDYYLSAVNNQMSEIMKVLTIIATIFIPLSFIASLYGMNFAPDASGWNMPELRWRFGYPMALGLMALVALGQLYFFWRRGWLGRR